MPFPPADTTIAPVIAKTSERKIQDKEKKTVNRSTSTVKISIDGQDFDTNGLISSVLRVVVEENDDTMDMAVVVVSNFREIFSNDVLFKEGSIMKISTGYSTGDLVDRGTFSLKQPRIFHRRDGSSEVHLIGFGEEVVLTKDKKRRSFGNQKDSDIAKEIAQENGLKADVKETSTRHEFVIQAGVTDMVFLRQRAELNGYQLFVQDGVLHFHPVRVKDSGVVLKNRLGAESNMIAFDVKVDSYRRGSIFKASRFDPISGKIVSSSSAGVRDEVTGTEEKLLRDQEIRSVESISGEPVEFLVGIGHELNKGELDTLVESFSQSGRYVVRGQCIAKGNERVKARSNVLILGVQKYTGNYYVKKVVHSISDKYEMTLEIRRALTGQLAISPAVVVSDSAASGVRTPKVGGPEDVSIDVSISIDENESFPLYDDGTGEFIGNAP